uniref:GrpE like 2, mitochondrial n=1 Tax=Chelydra serpentina TaxID=8475 RepID=A0A8C3SKG1_CHESE
MWQVKIEFEILQKTPLLPRLFLRNVTPHPNTQGVCEKWGEVIDSTLSQCHRCPVGESILVSLLWLSTLENFYTHERYRKALADSENVRRRTQKFVEDAKLFGIQSFCKDLVEVADILEKTTESTERETEPSDPKPTLKKIYEGLSLIEAKLQSVFAKHGLQKMNPVGGKYDPYDHEIVCHVPAEGMQPGTVALVTQDGYKLHGRTIRHAHVGVAVESQE